MEKFKRLKYDFETMSSVHISRDLLKKVRIHAIETDQTLTSFFNEICEIGLAEWEKKCEEENK